MRLPRWIIGPSGPTGIPAPTARAHEPNLTRKVSMLKNCLIIVPLRKLISSGVPEPVAHCLMRTTMKTNKKKYKKSEPAALGLMRTTRAVLARTKARLYVEAVNQDRRR